MSVNEHIRQLLFSQTDSLVIRERAVSRLAEKPSVEAALEEAE